MSSLARRDQERERESEHGLSERRRGVWFSRMLAVCTMYPPHSCGCASRRVQATLTEQFQGIEESGGGH